MAAGSSLLRVPAGGSLGPVCFTTLRALSCLPGPSLSPAPLSPCLLCLFFFALCFRRWKNSRAIKGSLVQNYRVVTSRLDLLVHIFPWAVQQTYPLSLYLNFWICYTEVHRPAFLKQLKILHFHVATVSSSQVAVAPSEGSTAYLTSPSPLWLWWASEMSSSALRAPSLSP